MRIRSLPSRIGLPSFTSAAGAAGCVCSVGPVVAGPLAAVGLGGLAAVLHGILVLVLAPLNLLLLGRGFSRHRDPKGLLVAGTGVLLIYMHFLGDDGFPAVGLRLQTHVDSLIYIGAALLIAGALLDWRAQRRPVAFQ